MGLGESERGRRRGLEKERKGRAEEGRQGGKKEGGGNDKVGSKRKEIPLKISLMDLSWRALVIMN